MEIKLIVAVDGNNGIGKDGKLPWHLPQDLAHFKRLTMGKPVVMGRKTWEALPDNCRPLKGRLNAILTTRPESQIGCRLYAHSIDNVLYKCKARCFEQCFIIGGATIYQQALDMGIVDKLYITRVKGDYDCDVFMPEIDYSKWQLIESDDVGVCVFEVYEKATR